MTLLAKCPECGGGVTRHCPETNKTCSWQKCSRPACSAVLDPANSRGFVMRGSTAMPVRWSA